MTVKSLVLATITAITTSAFAAEGIDMNDPLRAVAREGDVRIDAQLLRDTVSPGAAIAVKYQIQNFSDHAVAVAEKIMSASFDQETQTITLAIGAETPNDVMPQLITIEPGEKKVFRASAVPSLGPTAARGIFGTKPRYVQVKVTILRGLEPFQQLIASQARGPQPLPDALFDQWFESSDTIFLNTLPVQFSATSSMATPMDVEQQHRGRTSRRLP